MFSMASLMVSQSSSVDVSLTTVSDTRFKTGRIAGSFIIQPIYACHGCRRFWGRHVGWLVVSEWKREVEDQILYVSSRQSDL